MYFVSFTANNGLTVGASGESLVSALALMADEFGDEIIHLYAHAREDVAAALFLEAGSDEVDEGVRADLYSRLQAQKVDDGGPVDGAVSPPDHDHAGGEAAVRGGAGGSEAGAPATAAADDSDAEAAPHKGGSSEAPEEGDQQDDNLSIFAPADEPSSRCTVCGEPLTPDVAKASKLMYGEERCADCFAF